MIPSTPRQGQKQLHTPLPFEFFFFFSFHFLPLFRVICLATQTTTLINGPLREVWYATLMRCEKRGPCKLASREGRTEQERYGVTEWSRFRGWIWWIGSWTGARKFGTSLVDLHTLTTPPSRNKYLIECHSCRLRDKHANSYWLFDCCRSGSEGGDVRCARSWASLPRKVLRHTRHKQGRDKRA